MTAWTYLVLAGLLEMTWATTMKYSDGFSRLLPSGVTLVAAIGSVALLTIALKELPVSIGYPAWVGMGTIGTVIAGMILFGEGMTLAKAVSTLAILAGVIGLKLSASSPD